MANRTLDRSSVFCLFDPHMEGRSFKVYQPDINNPRVVVTDKQSGFTIDFATQDLMLSDTDFVENRVKPFVANCKRGKPEDIEVLMPGGGTHTLVMPLLSERGKTHGDYSHLAQVIQNIKRAVASGSRCSDLTDTQRESLDLIATKIGRIVAGDPHHQDHWDDIIGYATLARDRIAFKKG